MEMKPAERAKAKDRSGRDIGMEATGILFQNLVERYFAAAFEAATVTSFSIDENACAAARQKSLPMKQRIEDLGSWIAEYSAARAPRGASTFPSRDTAAAAIAHFDRIEEEPGHEFIDRQPSASELENPFATEVANSLSRVSIGS